MKLTNSFVITEVKKKSRTPVFINAKVGDVLHFEMTLCATNGASRGSYAAYVDVYNEDRTEHHVISQTKLVGLVRRGYVLEEVKA